MIQKSNLKENQGVMECTRKIRINCRRCHKRRAHEINPPRSYLRICANCDSRPSKSTGRAYNGFSLITTKNREMMLVAHWLHWMLQKTYQGLLLLRYQRIVNRVHRNVNRSHIRDMETSSVTIQLEQK